MWVMNLLMILQRCLKWVVLMRVNRTDSKHATSSYAALFPFTKPC
jgi:hypothetical protein